MFLCWSVVKFHMLCKNSGMRIGAFEVDEPLPQSEDLHAIALLYPWVDAGSVGTLALETLERHLGARELGRLARPGSFFDFTRYRPVSRLVEGQRVITIPNTNIYYASGNGGPDYLFIHLMEPHASAEQYIHSVLELLKKLNVKRYCRISAMYNAVPHTRPLRVTGSPGLESIPGMAGLITPRQQGSGYQGPTSIMNNVSEGLERVGVENISFMVHLPHYLNLEEDYAGTARILEVLSALYKLPTDLADFEHGKQQYQDVGAEVQQNPQVKSLVERLEEYYDAQQSSSPPPLEEEAPPLSADIEQFLNEIGRRLEDNN